MAEPIDKPGLDAAEPRPLTLKEQGEQELREGIEGLRERDHQAELDEAGQAVVFFKQELDSHMEVFAGRYDLPLIPEEKAQADALKAEAEQALKDLAEATAAAEKPAVAPTPVQAEVPVTATEPRLDGNLPADRAGLLREQRLLQAKYDELFAIVQEEAEGKSQKAAYKQLLKSGGPTPDATEAGLELNRTYARLNRIRQALA